MESTKWDGALVGAMKFRLSHCLYGPKNNYIIDVNLFAHHTHGVECTNEGVGI
jgi:hypothetical protein